LFLLSDNHKVSKPDTAFTCT